MSRYIMFWEYNHDHCPLENDEKVKQWLSLADATKDILKSGEIKDWAHYAGESAGYVVVEGNEQDVLKLASLYIPYVRFTTKALLNMEQCEQVWKSL